MEKIEHIGLVRDFPKERDARREADRLGRLVRINEPPRDTRIRFDVLAEHYLKNDFGADAVRPKTERTTSTLSKSFVAISFPGGEMKSRTTSNPSTFSAG